MYTTIPRPESASGNIYKQIGNAVPCEMAKTVACAVAEYISIHSKDLK